MRFDIVTLFPKLFPPYLNESILARAKKKKLLKFKFWNPIDFTKDKHRKVDSPPYGGGPGMLMTAQPLFDVISAAKKENSGKVIFLTPQGKRLTQSRIRRISKENSEGLILVCGRYEGIDQRIRDLLIDEEISIGDFVLTGGEIPAIILIDAISRFVPGVLGCDISTEEESFSTSLKGKREYPQYTKPREFKGLKVPEVLLSGNHKEIKKWRMKRLK